MVVHEIQILQMCQDQPHVRGVKSRLMNFGQVQGVWVFEFLRIHDIEKIHKRHLIYFVCDIC